VRVFIAGASGVIGIRLIPLLAADGHVVAGMTRSTANVDLLRELGALPVVGDVYDADALTRALTGFGPEVVFHQLTDLPDDAGDRARYGAARQTMPALQSPPGLTIVADDRAARHH
jgi:nucleoside-diphosphate-sugar epimerase